MQAPQKSESRADAALAILNSAITDAAKNWRYFLEQIDRVGGFKSDVSLRDRIFAFSIPESEGLKGRFEALKNAPDGLLLLIVAKGVESSRTHTREQIEQALGLQMPD